MNRSEYTLIFLLRLGGSLQLLALVAVFLPTGTMDGIHRWLGLGSLPSAPIVEYLSRSLSMFYAIHGGFMWCLSFDVARFRPLIIFVALSNTALGLVLFGVDILVGMPGYWVWFEGPPIVMVSLLLLALTLKARAS